MVNDIKNCVIARVLCDISKLAQNRIGGDLIPYYYQNCKRRRHKKAAVWYCRLI